MFKEAMKITKKDLILLVKEELQKQINESNDDAGRLRVYKIDNFQEVIRIIEKLRLIETDIVAIELLEKIKEDLSNETLPEEDLMKKFTFRLDIKISDFLAKIELIDRELKLLTSSSEKEEN